MNTSTTILSWNANGLFKHYEDLKTLISFYNSPIICLQETHLKNNQTINFAKYNIIRSPAPDHQWACGGVLLGIPIHLNYIETPLRTNLQATAATIYLSSPLTICTIYLPPNKDIETEDLKDLVAALPRPFIICGDFNAHSPTWGSRSTNNRGRIIESLIFNSDLILTHPRDPTHYNFSHKTWSTLDLTIHTPQLSSSLRLYNHVDMAGSDHFPSVLHLTDPSSPSFTQTPKRNYRKTDWDKYTESFPTLPIFDDALNTTDIARDFTNLLISHANSCSPPMRSSNSQRKMVPWWNDECKKAIRERRKALKQLKKNYSLENHVHFQKLRARARFVQKQAKRNSWANFVSSINSSTSSSTIWRKIRSLDRRAFIPFPTSIKHEDSIITDIYEVAQSFASHFAKSSSDDNLMPVLLSTKQNTESKPLNFSSNCTEPYNSLISMDELNHSLKSSKPSAVGPDGLHIFMLQHAPERAKITLLHIFNHIWTSNTFPDHWKIAEVIPILKQNKNPMLVDNYRPISLTSVLGKILEKIINNRLNWELDSRNLLSAKQCGFRAGRSTTDQILFIHNAAKEAFSKHQHLLAVFFDCKKAFDMAWACTVLVALHEWGFRGHLPLFIANFLANRQFYVRLGQTTSPHFRLCNGVPQGSVLSPTLFNIAINSLTHQIEQPIQGALFADDLAVFVPCSDVSLGETVLQEGIDRLLIWADRNGFQFSTEKTVAMHLCRRYRCNHECQLHIGEIPLTTVSSTRYLGVIFDEKLSYKEHISNLKLSCNRKMNLLKKLSHSTYGSDRKTMLRIYHAIIKSKIDYACQAYADTSTKNIKALDAIHHTAIRLATGALRTSPIKSLLCESSEYSLDLSRKILALRTYFHLKADDTLPLTSHPSFAQLQHQVEIAAASLQITIPPFLPTSRTVVAPWQNAGISYDLSLIALNKKITTNAIILAAFSELTDRYKNFEHIYTDGSKSDSGVGCGIATKTEIILRFSLPSLFSILSAELYAIKLSIEHILKFSTDTPHLILTDSLNAIACLRDFRNRNQHPIAKSIIQCLLNSRTSITFVWLPSHVGIPGNSLADTAAKEGSTMFPVPDIAITRDDWKNYVKRAAFTTFQDRWSAVSPLTNKLRSIRDSARPWLTSTAQCRREEVLVCRLRLGHTRITHGYILEKASPPTCVSCNTPLSVKHILVDCPSFSHERSLFNLKSSLPEILGDSPHSLHSLLSFLKSLDLIKKI